MARKRKLKPEDLIKKGDYYKNGKEFVLVPESWTGLKPKNLYGLTFYRETNP